MDKTTLNGFEVFEDFAPGAMTKTTIIEKPETETEDDAIVEELTDEELEEIRKQGKKSNTEDSEEDEEEEDVKPAKTNKKSKKEDIEDTEEQTENEDEDTEEINENETTVVSGFFDSLSEKLGWEDIEDEEKPKTVEDLIDYFQNVIEENSVPQYASEEVAQLDEFVKNGGNLKDYFQIDGELDIDNINIEDDEVNQKLVLKEFLKEKGFSSKSIEKKLTKYEEAGLLEDEAVDALESLKEIREEKKQQLLEEQKKTAELNRKKQQDYFNSVVNEIKGLDNIRGVKIPEKDKKTLLEYIFKPTADGMTQYQKDWSKSVKNLLESAYFTMKGDTLLKAAKTEGSNKAISKFKDSLNRTGVSRKTRKQDNTSNESMWNSIVRQLRAN